MKKILVTGAAGTIGLQVIRFLLSEGKYEITALELRNVNSYRRLKPFRKRINIVYGDVNDNLIVDALIKDHDVVIHLAGVLPPFANVHEDICKEVDFNGTQTIVNSIRRYNPNCYLLYASSTSVYGKQEDYKNINKKTKFNIDEYDFYSKYKIECERYIKNNLKNYTILRLAYILGDPGTELLIYNVPLNCKMEVLSAEDAGYAFVCAIDYKNKINKKIYNVSGGDKFRVVYRDYVEKVFINYGISLKFIASWLMAEKNYCGGYYKDANDLEDILHYRSKNLGVYYNNVLVKYKTKFTRVIPRVLAKPFIYFYKKKKKI